MQKYDINKMFDLTKFSKRPSSFQKKRDIKYFEGKKIDEN